MKALLIFIVTVLASVHSFASSDTDVDQVTSVALDAVSDEPLPADPVNECYSNSRQISAIDKTYDYINTQFCQPAIWFDSFFVDDRVEGDARAGTMVRWSFDYIWSDIEGFELKTKLKAKLHLPKASKKLKLVFESFSEDDVFDLFPTSEDDLEESLGLRYDWYAREKSSFNIKVSLSPGIEARYRYSQPINQDSLVRYTQRLYHRKGVLGEQTQIDLDYTLSQNFLFRWVNFAKFEDDTNSFEFGTGVTLYQSLSEKSALSYRLSMTAMEKPKTYINNTYVSVTYRQNFYRDWLFYEIEPAYDWSEENYGDETVEEGTVILRLEFLFNNV